MLTQTYTRTKGQCLTYEIIYDQAEYFITRDGILKKTMPDALIAGIAADEARADLMLSMAIADIEFLIGMDE